MTAQNPSVSLGWVREDLDRLLVQLHSQIEHLASLQGVPEEVLGEVTERLEDLLLTFQVLMLQGPTMLAQDMVALSRGLAEQRIEKREAAFEALVEALVVLPAYLDRLQTGHHDLPLLLMPVLNAMRRAHGIPELQESSLFAPDLDTDLPELAEIETEPADPETLGELTQRLRQQFESAMLDWLNEQTTREHLAPLQGVCETLVRRLGREDMRRTWWIASGMLEGFAARKIRNDAHFRRLLARLHLNLKHLSEDGEPSLEPQSVRSLAQALLYRVALTRPGHRGLDRLRKAFDLKALLPDQEALLRARGSVSGKDRHMFESLGAAVADELTLIKDALDLELRSGETDANRRRLCQEALSRLADTLRMLGLPDLAGSVQALSAEVDRTDGTESPEHRLMPVAEELLRIEAAVEEQIETLGEPLSTGDLAVLIEMPPTEFRKVVEQLLNEAVANIRQLQDAVRKRLDGHRADDAFHLIGEVAGALELLGSARAAELAKSLEETLRRVLEGVHTEASLQPGQLDCLADAIAAMELYLAAMRDQQGQQERLESTLEDRLERLRLTPAGEATESATAEGDGALDAAGEDRAEDAETTISSDAVVNDPELLAVFLEEYEDVSETLQDALPRWLSHLKDAASLTEVRRCFHTLKGSGRMVGAFELGDFCWQIESMLNALLASRIAAFADVAVTVRLAQAALPALKQRLMGQSSGLSHEVIEAVGRHADRVAGGHDADWEALRKSLPGFLAGMLPETTPATKPAAADRAVDEVPERMREALDRELHVVETLLDSVSLERSTLASEAHVQAMNRIAETLELQPEGREVDIARALADALQTQREKRSPFNNDALWVLGSCFAFFQARLDRLEGDADSESPDSEDSLLEQIATLKAWFGEAEALPPESARDAPARTEAAAEVAEKRAESGPPESTAGPGPARAPQPESQPEPEPQDRSPLDDITRIFLEEAREVLGRCDSLLNTWRDNLHAMPLVQNLQREIHTFKGGARMAGLEPLGELSHTMEELLERTASHEVPPTPSSVQVLEQGCDQLNTWVESVARGREPDPGDVLQSFKDRIERITREPEATPAAEPAQAPAEPKVLTDIPEVELPQGGGEEKKEKKSIRVDAELLDDLIKSAGEVNIFRARMERQVAQLRGNLGEFNETIGRLREQFRKLEMETEAQIRSRYHDAAIESEDEFDPLELDRFSSMQQLSRGLSESVADLLNLEEMLEDAARQSDTLLSQQSRVSTELQEGLMKTRMVPFGSIAPRLRRLVRTATSETGKKARLKLLMAGSSDQLDRNVLEHITVPLEHMLRNAVAHGIEDPTARKKAGKEPEGEITVTVEAEATEFVIRVEDDGAGIDRGAIRQRAIEQGLIGEDAAPPPEQLFELILGSGFSTSATVTGLAGRGVGMDVVNSEIKQIGGSLEIRSEEGQGSCFTIRIPFSLAVMNAIGVVAGEQRYFVPLASVAGVARVPPAEYQALLDEDQPTYRFAGQSYPLLELEPLLGEPARALGSDNVSLLMISSGEQRAAFRVPELLGHREVVIKPVGPQITSVPGILGGTVTGDGRVVIVLDLGPIIRQALLHGVRPVITERVVTHERHRKVAMVVDDSITMRKVNSRVLQGEDIETVTAKDGQDAVEQMQDRIPDILLLDIEMPRMDGYQLAEYVRGDARLREIPIVMITSRSGRKHRERAEQAGANAYLTKPYKESELVATVFDLLGMEKA